MKLFTMGGCHSATYGWSETSSIAVVICKSGVYFEDARGICFVEAASAVYSFEQIAELLVKKYGNFK